MSSCEDIGYILQSKYQEIALVLIYLFKCASFAQLRDHASKNPTYRIPLDTISADPERADSWAEVCFVCCGQIAAVRLSCAGGPAALVLCAGMRQLEASEPLRHRGGSRYESLNCPLFYPGGWMVMQRVCQVELGGNDI